MALTLRSSTSFLTPIDPIKAHRTAEEFPSWVHVGPPKPAFRLRAVRASSHHDVLERGAATPQAGRLHGLRGQRSGEGGMSARVPVYVMLPLDTVSASGGLSRARALNASLMALRSAGVEGVMVDVWWGLVEKDGPVRYNWEAYMELVKMVERNGLKLQMVMSFHQCGGNVGDSCSIPLPPWVLEEMSNDPDIVYTDRSGRRNPEYISLGCDTLPVLRGRTPIQVYADFMRSFRERFSDYLGNVIVVSINPVNCTCSSVTIVLPWSSSLWRVLTNSEYNLLSYQLSRLLQILNHIPKPVHLKCS